MKAELVFCAGTDVAAMFAASFLTTSFLTTSFLTVPADSGCRDSDAGSAAIVVLVCAAGAGTTAGLSSTFANAVVVGSSAASASGMDAVIGASNSGSSEGRGGGAVAAAPRLAGGNELPADFRALRELPRWQRWRRQHQNFSAEVLARREAFPLPCSTLIGLVSTRLAPMR